MPGTPLALSRGLLVVLTLGLPRRLPSRFLPRLVLRVLLSRALRLLLLFILMLFQCTFD